MFKLIALIALLVVSSHGIKISISSNGAYVARCFIEIKDNLGPLTLASGNIYAGQTREMEFPDGVTWMKVRCENQRLVGKWSEVFSQESNGPRSLCYNIGGTTFHPTHSARVLVNNVPIRVEPLNELINDHDGTTFSIIIYIRQPISTSQSFTIQVPTSFVGLLALMNIKQ